MSNVEITREQLKKGMPTSDVRAGDEVRYMENRLQEDSMRRSEIGTETLFENKEMRKKLMNRLTWISVSWLFFTAVIIFLMGCERVCYNLSPSVGTAFVTTSLATVLGLWVIGLRYFFYTGK